MTTPLSALRADARAALLALDLAPAHQRRVLEAFDHAPDPRSLGPLLADLLRLPHDDEPQQAAVDAVSLLRLALRGVAVVPTHAGVRVTEPTDPPPPSDATPTPPTGTVVLDVAEPTDPPPPKALTLRFLIDLLRAVVRMAPTVRSSVRLSDDKTNLVIGLCVGADGPPDAPRRFYDAAWVTDDGSGVCDAEAAAQDILRQLAKCEAAALGDVAEPTDPPPPKA